MKTLLISAYGCEPNRGSESGIGWNWMLQLAKNNKLHVVTRSNNREPIEKCLPTELKENITFHYYDCPQWIRRFKNGDRGLYFYYACWQLGVKKIFKKLANEHHFDYSWHLSFGSWWMPTFLHKVDIPFIYGPLGGMDGVPIPFLKTLPLKDRIIQSFRYVLLYTVRFNPFVMRPAQKAVAILGRTENNINFLPEYLRKKSSVILETSMDMSELPLPSEKIEKERIELICTGRLVPFKNLKCAIDALALVKEKYDFHFSIIGKGPDEDKITKLIHEHGLEKNIEVKKQMPRPQLLRQLETADIYLFPSLREAGTWALMEALAMELPTVCLNWSGMKVICDSSCAIMIDPSNYDTMVHKFAEAICKLIENPDLRKQMGKNGRERMINMFNWEAKGKFIEDLFEKLDK